jgi:hypothetical protein
LFIHGTKAQLDRAPLYDASGTITTGGTPQLIRAMVPSCSHFVIQNLSAANSMYVEFGSARATATISGGTISAITVTNGGFGFTYPPIVRFAGGGIGENTKNLGLNQPGGEGPNSAITQGRPAIAHAVLTSGVVTSIVIDDPGAGYTAKGPYVFLQDTTLDPYGCANPFFGSAVSGILLGAGGSYYSNGTVCTTDPISIYCSASAQPFTFKWMV